MMMMEIGGKPNVPLVKISLMMMTLTNIMMMTKNMIMASHLHQDHDPPSVLADHLRPVPSKGFMINYSGLDLTLMLPVLLIGQCLGGHEANLMHWTYYGIEKRENNVDE